MSDTPHKSHSAIRTFAQDLAAARKTRGQSTDHAPSTATEPSKEPSQQPKAPIHQPAQAPAKTTPVKIESKVAPHITVTEPTKPSKATPSDPSHNSPFSSLQEEMDAVTKKEPSATSKSAITTQPEPKISVKKNSKPSRANIGFDATIITDNKQKRFNPFTATVDSFKKWLKAFSFSTKKKSPVYTVPDTQRRKGVIQKATSKSGSIFTADSAELKAKIKRRQKQAEAQKQAHEEEGEISWSPYTDSGFALLESPEESARVAHPHNVSIEFKNHTRPAQTTEVKTTSIPPVPPAPKTTEPPAALTPEANEPATEKEQTDSRWNVEPTSEPEPKPVVDTRPVAPLPAPAVEPVPTEPVATPAPKVPKPTVEPREPDQQESTTKKPSGNSFLQSYNTNALAMGLVAGLSCIVVLFFITLTLINYISNIEPVVTLDTTSYLENATVNPVVVTQVNSITDIPLQAGTLLGTDYVDTQLFYENGEVVPPAVIISALQFRLLPSYVQSLSDIRFAQKSQSKPIIVFEFSDEDTALGGFLAWEDNMATDLKEIYLITEIINTSFTDDTVSGKDIRILQSADGKVLAVYGLTSENTAIVTSSLETFTEVMQASFKK